MVERKSSIRKYLKYAAVAGGVLAGAAYLAPQCMTSESPEPGQLTKREKELFREELMKYPMYNPRLLWRYPISPSQADCLADKLRKRIWKLSPGVKVGTKISSEPSDPDDSAVTMRVYNDEAQGFQAQIYINPEATWINSSQLKPGFSEDYPDKIDSCRDIEAVHRRKNIDCDRIEDKGLMEWRGRERYHPDVKPQPKNFDQLDLAGKTKELNYQAYKAIGECKIYRESWREKVRNWWQNME